MDFDGNFCVTLLRLTHVCVNRLTRISVLRFMQYVYLEVGVYALEALGIAG